MNQPLTPFGPGQLWLERIAEPEPPEWLYYRDLLLHFDTPAPFHDSGTNGLVGYPSNCTPSSSIKKWGTSSLSSQGDGLIFYDNPNLIIGGLPFSVEFWVRVDSASTHNRNQYFYSMYTVEAGDTDPNQVQYVYTTPAESGMNLAWYFLGTAINANAVLNYDQWYFLQFNAWNDSIGWHVKMAVDGNITHQSYVENQQYYITSSQHRVGGITWPLTGINDHPCLWGNMDDFRLTIGYNQPVTLPTGPFLY